MLSLFLSLSLLLSLKESINVSSGEDLKIKWDKINYNDYNQPTVNIQILKNTNKHYWIVLEHTISWYSTESQIIIAKLKIYFALKIYFLDHHSLDFYKVNFALKLINI